MFHGWFVDQIAFVSPWIDHLGRVDAGLRDCAVLRARHFWTPTAGSRPSASAMGWPGPRPGSLNRLRRTPQGCDWMIDRWERLAAIAREGGWDDLQKSLAFDLLGACPEERDYTLPAQPEVRWRVMRWSGSGSAGSRSRCRMPRGPGDGRGRPR